MQAGVGVTGVSERVQGTQQGGPIVTCLESAALSLEKRGEPTATCHAATLRHPVV